MELASRFDLKGLAKAALASPLPYAVLSARALRASPITVLCYHTIRPDNEPIDAWTAVRRTDFVRQMEFLRARYDIVSLDDALDGEAAQGGRPRAVVTFDDGEVGLYDSLLPIVSEMCLPVTVYIATAQIESGRAYWFDSVMNALQAEGPFTIDLSAAGLKAWTIAPQRGVQRWSAIADILEALKAVGPDKREALAAALVAQAPKMETPQFKPLQPMSIAQLQELASNEWVTIAAHSHCHSLLDQIPASEVTDSVARSRELLEAWTGRDIRHFAYPNGNYNQSVEEIVAGLGFRSAMALNDRLWRRDMAHFALPRVSIGRYDDFSRFKLRLAEI